MSRKCCKISLSVIGMILFASGITIMSVFLENHTDPTKYQLSLEQIKTYGDTHLYCRNNQTIYLRYYDFSNDRLNCSKYKCDQKKSSPFDCGSFDPYAINCVDIIIFNITSGKTKQIPFNQCYANIDSHQVGYYYDDRSISLLYTAGIIIISALFIMTLIHLLISIFVKTY
jgi:hypothetical protein